MLPTEICVFVTPGSPPPTPTPALALPQAVSPTASATTAADTVANLPRRLRDIGPPLPCHLLHDGRGPVGLARPRIDVMPDVCVSSCFATVAWACVLRLPPPAPTIHLCVDIGTVP